jgi:hypothetical protein
MDTGEWRDTRNADVTLKELPTRHADDVSSQTSSGIWWKMPIST